MQRATTTGVMVLMLGIAVAAQESAPAATRLDDLLTAMGGRDAWARVTGMRVLATHHDADLPAPFENTIVNDFGKPAVRIQARGPDYLRVQVVTAESGWRSDGRTHTALDAERLRGELRWWEANVYRTLVRLARGDTSLKVEWTAPDRLAVVNADGIRLNWFRLNQRSEPIAFGTWDNEVGTVFGPLAAGPGGIRYPKWGASPDGRWRYEIDRITTFGGTVNVDVEPPTSR